MSMDDELEQETARVLQSPSVSTEADSVGWRTGLAVLWFQSSDGLESRHVTLVRGSFSPSVRPVIPDWRQRVLAA